MSVIKSYDINDLKPVSHLDKIASGIIVRHVLDDRSFGMIVSAERGERLAPRDQLSHQRPSWFPEPGNLIKSEISVLWTREPSFGVQAQTIKSRSSVINSKWTIEEAEDMLAFNTINTQLRVPSRPTRQFSIEETHYNVDNETLKDLHLKGADVEVNADGTVFVRRTLPFTPESVREYNRSQNIKIDR